MRNRRRQGAGLIALALVALGALAIGLLVGRSGLSRERSSVSSTPVAGGEEFGANTGRLFNDHTYSAAEIAAQLSALHDTGATVARSDAPWEATEPSPPTGGVHHYDWAFDDLIAGALAASNLTWVPIIDYSPAWARAIGAQDHSAPNAEQYAAYAEAVAARYGSGGSFWESHPQLTPRPVDTYEIWNEPDNPVFWVPQPDPAAYADLYTRARQAIDAAQPGARVLVGGLTHPTTFLPALLAAAPALRHQLDGVAIHPYAVTPERVLAAVGAARAELVSLGLPSLPLYVTEFGWTTSPPGALDYVSERLRPGYIEQTLTQLGHTNCNLAAVLLYAWVTPEKNLRDAQDWFGIHPPNGGAAPDTAAFAAGLHAAAASGSTSQVCR